MLDSAKIYHIRVEGVAGHYGLGEEVIPGVCLFKAGHYGLTVDELQALITTTAKQESRANL